MKKHELTPNDVELIFRGPFVISLASCARSDRSKSLECHVDLGLITSSYYVVQYTVNKVLKPTRYASRQAAVDAYNEIDV